MPQVINGTTYKDETPKEVVAILEMSRREGIRIRIHYGYTKPTDHKPVGTDWHEENDVTGHVGRSTGSVKIPLMIPNARSSGGTAILDHCIVRIRSTNGVELYRHPQYKPGKATVETIDETHHGKRYTASVKIDGQTHANFQTRQQAIKWIAKMGLDI